MKFLVDAQLPRRLAAWLADAGYEAIHTLDLPQANRTPDNEVCAVILHYIPRELVGELEGLD